MNPLHLPGKLLRRVRELPRRFDTDYRPVFVCGAAGGGNSLLSGLLHQRYRTAAFADESALRMDRSSPLAVEKTESYGSLAGYRRAIEQAPQVTVREVRRSALEYYRRRTLWPKASSVVIDKAPFVHLVRVPGLRQAFPNSRFVLVFRDPAANLEGLRRKWPVTFGAAALEDLCAFYEETHRRFLRDTAPLGADLLGVSLEDLTSRTEEVLTAIAAACGMLPRASPLAVDPQTTRSGKGLRAVSDGQIRIDPHPDSEARARLSPAEAQVIDARLAPLHRELTQRFA